MNRRVLALLVIAMLPPLSEAQAQRERVRALSERERAQAAAGNRLSPFVHWNYSWGDTKASHTDIGSSAGRTCFLTGVTGNLRPRTDFYQAQPSDVVMAGVRSTSSGRYEIFVQPHDGHALQVFVHCVNVAADIEELNSWEVLEPQDLEPRVLAPATPGRQCFLTQIRNNPHYANNAFYWGFLTNAHNVRVFQRTDSDNITRWYIGGYQPQSFVGARATCFDVHEVVMSETWNAGATGSRKDALTNVSGATCGLTGFGGPFDADDLSDGAYITSEGSQFFLNTKNGKRGWVTCVR
jgi:hypothetical protein